MDLPAKPTRGLQPKTTDRIDLEAEFHKIGERRGYIGAAHGELAYAYVRVSSETQSEEGRSGLPRQLLHIHELAQRGVPEQKIPPLKITWEMVYADEGYSGFEFRNRPALTTLLEEIYATKRARYILIEHIDRLSRHATWHQGYLLEQIEKAGCQAVFWHAFNSAIERSVMGAIAEQGMKQEMQRMLAGQVLKAKDGRVTAKRASFGYMFVNSKGQPQQRAGSDTHYALHSELAPVMRWIYHAISHDGLPAGAAWDAGAASGTELGADGSAGPVGAGAKRKSGQPGTTQRGSATADCEGRVGVAQGIGTMETMRAEGLDRR